MLLLLIYFFTLHTLHREDVQSADESTSKEERRLPVSLFSPFHHFSTYLPMIKTSKMDEEAEYLRSCRLTGFGVFTGVGIYALYDAQKRGTFKSVRPVGSPLLAGKAQAIVGFGESRSLVRARRKARDMSGRARMAR